MIWEELRKEHLATYNGTYLNSPANGLVSKKIVDRVRAEEDNFLANPGDYRLDFILEKSAHIKQQQQLD